MNYARCCELELCRAAKCPAKGVQLRGIRTPAMTRKNAGLPACSLHLVPIQSRSLPAVLFSGLDGVKTRWRDGCSCRRRDVGVKAESSVRDTFSPLRAVGR